MAEEALLIRTLVELADSLVDDFDVVELLTLLSDRCVEALDIAAAGVMLAAPRGSLQIVASSSDAMRTLELLELEADEGPCVDCYRTGRPLTNLDLSSLAARWPVFAAEAVAAGFASVHALPMHLRDQTIGAVNLFQTDVRPLSEPDAQAAQAFADVATIAILQHRSLTSAQVLASQLNEALNSRVTIEQAKGRISEATGLDMQRSFALLRGYARSHNLALTALARRVADGDVDPELLRGRSGG